MSIKRRVPILPVWMFLSLLTGCSTEVEDVWKGNEKAIRFSLPPRTRAIINNLTDLETDGNTYAVWGHCKKNTGSGSTERLFNQEPIVYNADTRKWNYTTEERYWGIGNTYHFHALYPMPDKLTGTVAYNSTQPASGALSITGFDVVSPNNLQEKVDLLYASNTSINVNTDSDIPQNGVSLGFNHLLSRVAFVGRSDEKDLGTGRRVIIDSATLYGIHTTGNWSSETVTDNTPSGLWTPTGNALIQSNNVYHFSSPEPLPITGGISIFEGKELFLPQSLENAVLEITYHYNYTNANEPLQSTGIVHLHELTKKWEPGKSYRYPFTVSNHIFFQTPTVEEWKQAPVNGSDFNVDIDEENP